MIQTRSIHFATTLGPFIGADPVRLKEWKNNFSAMISRRMTKPALMIGECLKALQFAAEDSVLYASTYSESICLENYLATFPTPSPLHFQNSIHPSGLEQVLIARKQPISDFQSFAGKTDIAFSALVGACMSDRPRQWMIGAEEQGTWLTAIGCASPSDICLCLGLSTSPTDQPLGSIVWDPNGDSPLADCEESLTVSKLFDRVRERSDISCFSESLGSIQVRWNR